MKKTSEWYHLIDAIRGFALLNMLAYHFLYDLFIVFGIHPGWYLYPPVEIWQQFICITFITVSGISWHFGSSHFKKGLLLNLYGCVITFVTILFLPSESIWFGVLNLLGCAVLLMIPLSRYLEGKNPYIGFAISAAGFLIFRNVDDGYLSLPFLGNLNLPSGIYEAKIFTFLGFPYQGFTSSDYFPVLPWFFLYLAGYWLWEIAARRELRGHFLRRIPLLSGIGSRSIWIYLAHQPVLYVLAYGVYHLIAS